MTNYTRRKAIWHGTALASAVMVPAVATRAGAAAGEAAVAAPVCEGVVPSAPLVWRLSHLQAARRALAAGEPSLRPAFDALIARAVKGLSAGPFSVTHKPAPPPGGDRHDYWSLAPYWWPDPKKKDGLPYIQRDGERNPASRRDAFDRARMQAMTDTVTALALAAYFSGEARFAAKATALIDAWFLDPATFMRPHLRYGQSIPGRTDGRAIGIIDTRIFAEIVDAALLLDHLGAMPADKMAGFRNWCADYVRWLTTSPLGLEERAKKNNHGVFYDMQVCALSLFAGYCTLATRIMEDVRARIDSQIDKRGDLPLELERTRSFHYTVFTLDAFLTLARLGEHLGVDLYTYKGSGGGSIVKALTRLIPYAMEPETWPHPEMGTNAPGDLWQLVLRARTALDSPRLEAVARDAADRDLSAPVMLMTYRGA